MTTVFRPTTLEEALAAMATQPKPPLVLAGGTDLMVFARESFHTVLDLWKLEELS